MHTRTRPRTLTAAALSALLLAACSDAGEPSRPPTPAIITDAATPPPDTDPTSSPPDATPTTEEPPPTATTTPAEDAETTAAPPDAARPEIPEVANERTLEGALAYAETYLETVGYHVLRPEPEALAGFIVSEDCGFCQAWIEQNDLRLEAGTSGDRLGLEIESSEGTLDDAGAIISVEVSQPEVTFRTEDGRIDSVVEPAVGRFAFTLDWVDGRWTIATLQFGPDE